MTTDEYLSQLTNIDRRIADKIDEANRWYDVATSYGSREIKEDTVQTSHPQDKMASAIIQAIECKREAEAMAEQLTIRKQKIIKQIDSLKNEIHYSILKDYYYYDKNLVEIAKQENYSRRHMQRLYNESIRDFEGKYGEIYERWL